MNDSNNRDPITLEQIQAWAAEANDQEPLFYMLETANLKIYVDRNPNMIWQYGIGSKSKHYSGFYSETAATRTEMANMLLQAMSTMEARIEEETRKDLELAAMEKEAEERWQRILAEIKANARDTDGS